LAKDAELQKEIDVMRCKVFMVTLVALFLFAADAQRVSAQPGVGQIGPPEGIRRALEEKARQLDLGAPYSSIQEYTATPGGIRGWAQAFDRGRLFYVPGYGVLLMSPRMSREAYSRTGRESETLGFPISNEFRCLTPDPRDRYQLFERGTIFWRAAENRYSIEVGLARLATPGNCARPGGPTGTVVTSPTSRNRYRVSIVGFTANRQTFDGHQELDGKGDEVYIVAQVAKFQSNGEMTSYTYGRGVLMGDINQRPPAEERLQAGNLSPEGGIGDGSTYMPGRNPSVRYRSPTLPWVVYEGDLTAGYDALMVIPTIWEWDGDDRQLDSYRNVYFGPGRPEFFYGRPPIRSDWVTQLVSESVRSPNGIAPASWGRGPVITVASAQVWPIRGGDQPIGLDSPTASNSEVVGPRGVFVPKVLFLTERLAQRVVATNYPLPAGGSSSGNIATTVDSFARLGPGVVPIQYRGTDEGTGDYTLFVKVEQIR
jgi:hypothetical protein